MSSPILSERFDKLSNELKELWEAQSLLDDWTSLAQRIIVAANKIMGSKSSALFLDEETAWKPVFVRSGSKKRIDLSESTELIRNTAAKGKLLEKRGIAATEIALDLPGKVDCLIAPLHVGSSTLAALTVASPSREGFSEEEKNLFQLYSGYCGLILQNQDLRRHIKQMTENDPLTELPHCQTFYSYLIKAIRRSKKKGIPVTLMFLDIDNFRAYNDRFSHHEGNQLLREISIIFKNTCRRLDEVACRYGGEEFMVILEGKGREKSYKIAEIISKEVKTLHSTGRSRAEISVSIGLATFPKNGKDESELILAVDNALYYAKTLGPNNIFHFDDLPDQSTEFKPMIQSLSQTLMQHASEEASEEGLSVVDKLRDELDRVIHRSKEESSPELIGREAIFSLAATVDARDIYTRGHSEQVATYAHQIAETLGLSREEKEIIYLAGFLHDIGKIIIPDFILNKAETLLPSEWTPIKEHPAAGVRILEPFEGLSGVLPIVLHHHEKWNGKGYPLGLKTNKIPLGSRIIAVADSFDAMTSNRCYRPEKSIQVAIEELKKNAGLQFDPEVVSAFLQLGFESVIK